MRRTSRARALAAVTLALCARACAALPTRVTCDRRGSYSSEDLATTGQIMNETPVTVMNAIALGAGFGATYGANAVVTLELKNLKSGGAFVHATAGRLGGDGLAAWTARTDCATTSMYHKSYGMAASYEGVTWTAPSDVSNLPTVEILVASASGQGAVTRQTLTLTRDDNWVAPPPSTPTCDASAVPTNGASAGDCTATLAAGATCQPVCASGYTVSGTSACSSSGVLTPATCTAAPDPTPGGGYGSYGSSSSAASRAVSRSASLVFATILGGALA